MIKVEHVSKYFGNDKMAVEDISFQVEAGETLVLLGTSGCGKTTTLRMINLLLTPSSGNIYVNGRNIKEQSPEILRRGIGYVMQDNGLFPHYTVAENIAVVPRLLKWETQRIQSRTTTLLQKLHLPPAEYQQAYPRQLSGGQQQRVGLARALAADPPVLLMDEPFGALDPVTRSNVRKEFKSLDELQKKTIIMVTHDVQEAFELGDRICLLNKGRIQQIGTPAALLFKPANDFVSTFFGSQRLQLELQTVTLQDIWAYLPVQNKTSKTGEKLLSASTSCWEALEVTSNGQPLIIQHHQENKQADNQLLMAAFSQYKNK
ncbi:ABC transporter ATP-binding protein [Chitinophaga defluvii]|uniref:ATP-binding cassette domain-containing protein n=1 Tax=Chitinophaga defluvii TaxID=3163343 RepID=A0ABV2T5V1_9BACT